MENIIILLGKTTIITIDAILGRSIYEIIRARKSKKPINKIDSLYITIVFIVSLIYTYIMSVYSTL